MTAPRLSVLRSSAIVGAGTALSRVLGFVREILMAYFFGTTLAKSAFDVAFRIPNLFRRLFGEGALSAAFVPVFSEVLEREGRAAAGRLANKVMGLLLAVLLLLLAVVYSGLAAYATWGAPGERMAAVLPLLQIMLPYMLFICLAALCMGILNALHHFALPAFTPVLLNLVWIAVLLLAAPVWGDTPEERIGIVAWGILLAGCVQLAIQFPALNRLGMRIHPSRDWYGPRVAAVLRLMGPAAVGMGIHQINVCVDGFLALWAAPWAPAALTFSERLIYLPLGIFATSLGTVLLPAFSRQAAGRQDGAMAQTLLASLRAMFFLMLPASVGLAVLAEPVVRLVYQWQGGEFDAASTVRTVRALWMYSPGLLVFSLYKVLVPAFYARQDTRTPVRIGLWTVGLNFLLNILFVLTWHPEWKHAGLALATVVASTINCLLLAFFLDRKIGPLPWRALLAPVTLSMLLAVGAGATAWWTVPLTEVWAANLFSSQKMAQATGVFCGIFSALLVYGVGWVLCFGRRYGGALLRKLALIRRPRVGKG